MQEELAYIMKGHINDNKRAEDSHLDLKVRERLISKGGGRQWRERIKELKDRIRLCERNHAAREARCVTAAEEEKDLLVLRR